MCPVPTQITRGSLGDTTSAPIDALPWSSKSGLHVTPASFVLQTPPSAAPK